MFIIDTCVVSELIKNSPNHQVIKWVQEQPDGSLFLSALTAGEIAKGIEKLEDGLRKEKLTHWLHQEMLQRFSGRILAVDVDVALVFGELCGKASKENRTLPVVDTLIAATVLVHEMMLVTRNAKDFALDKSLIINPWEPD